MYMYSLLLFHHLERIDQVAHIIYAQSNINIIKRHYMAFHTTAAWAETDMGPIVNPPGLHH